MAIAYKLSGADSDTCILSKVLNVTQLGAQAGESGAPRNPSSWLFGKSGPGCGVSGHVPCTLGAR